MRIIGRIGLTVVAAVLLVQVLWANPPRSSRIIVPDMDCPSCAKGVVTKLSQVPGVAKAELNLKDAAVTVTPKEGKSLSPRALWEAVEQAGFRPSRLEGPDGVFTTKPRS
jgi:copper chaperone CopZ